MFCERLMILHIVLRIYAVSETAVSVHIRRPLNLQFCSRRKFRELICLSAG